MAVTNFEEFTHELNDYEKELLVPRMVHGLKRMEGKKNAITSTKIVSKLKKEGYKITPPRLRKVVHYIRVNSLVENLISTSKGYYVATSKEEMENYLKSLRERINSITVIYDVIERQTKNFN